MRRTYYLFHWLLWGMDGGSYYGINSNYCDFHSPHKIQIHCNQFFIFSSKSIGVNVNFPVFAHSL